MTKDELIRLKKKMETKVYIEDAFSGSGAISLFEIEQKINTAGAVENIEKYFESVITYFSSKGIKYDEITLRPLFSVIVKEKDLDENTIIKSNSKPLPGTAVVRINGFYCTNGEQKFGDDPDAIYSENFNDYVVILDDFIRLLGEKGFDFTGVSTVEELRDKVVAGHPTFGDITLSFNKRKIRTKA